MSAINLIGAAQTPTPSIVVAFKTFATNDADPVNTAVEFADATQQQGQGMHGSFGRADIYNNMAAIGPDFKTGFIDRAPVSNADLPVTVAKILNLPVKNRGKLKGRVLTEALNKKPAIITSKCGVIASSPSDEGFRTWLHYQEFAGIRYLDAAAKSSGDVSWGDWTNVLPCAAAKAR